MGSSPNLVLHLVVLHLVVLLDLIQDEAKFTVGDLAINQGSEYVVCNGNFSLPRASTRISSCFLALTARWRLTTLSATPSRARTTVTFTIHNHYNVLAPTLKVYPIYFFISQHMTDPLRHLVCEIRENDISPFRTNCFNA